MFTAWIRRRNDYDTLPFGGAIPPYNKNHIKRPVYVDQVTVPSYYASGALGKVMGPVYENQSRWFAPEMGLPGTNTRLHKSQYQSVNVPLEFYQQPPRQEKSLASMLQKTLAPRQCGYGKDYKPKNGQQVYVYEPEHHESKLSGYSITSTRY